MDVKISQDSLRKGSYYLTMVGLEIELKAVRNEAGKSFLEKKMAGAISVVASSYIGDHVFAPDPESVSKAREILNETSLLLAHDERDAGFIRAEAMRKQLRSMDAFSDRNSLLLRLFGMSQAQLDEEKRLQDLREEEEFKLLQKEKLRERIELERNSVPNPIKYGE